MLLGYDCLEQGFDVETQVFARTLTVKRTGVPFQGIIDASPAYIPDSLLGDDPREVGALEFKQADKVDLVQGDTLIQDGVDTWKAVKRDNNPSDFKIKYWLVKIV